METMILEFNTETRYKVFTIIVSPDNHSLRARVEIRYLNETGLWYLSIFNAATGEAICRYVPLIASYDEPNDLMLPFRHKNIGSILIVPIVNEPASEDPGLDNLNEFVLVWGDSIDT